MKTLIISLLALVMVGCVPFVQKQAPTQPQEVIITVKAAEPVDVEVETEEKINKSMTIPNEEGELSNLSFIKNGEAYTKLFSALTVANVTNLWNDICVLEHSDIRIVHLFINSPGGDAFSGLALADQIERAKAKGFHVIAYASGIIASAAVPVFAVCDERKAAPGTIFMVHETSIWKWPGRETASDIRSQNALMDLLRDRYLTKLTDNSNLTKDEWGELEFKTTWFSAQKAQEYGLVDKIE